MSKKGYNFIMYRQSFTAMYNTASIARLRHLVATIPARLAAIPPHIFNTRPANGKWSPKEIIGHLADSAANNHQRFIRGQYEETPVIFYDQDKWTALNHYNELDADHVIDLWTTYNKHLAEVASRIPPESLQRTCKDGKGNVNTLEWLIDDYVIHQEHHLKQIIEL